MIFLLVTALCISTFSQSEEEEEEINQTLLQDISKSTNQTIQNTTQSANGIGELVPIQKMLLTLEPISLKEQKI